MGLFDDYIDPQQFDSGGGLLGRLRALSQSQGQYQPDTGFGVGPAVPQPAPDQTPSPMSPGAVQRQADQDATSAPLLCQLPNGQIVPYHDMENGFGLINGGVNGGLGFGIGRGASDLAMPTAPKTGGLAGGGASGKVTSPASRVLRDVTGYARYAPLRPFTKTVSVGGSLAKALPFWGAILSFLDYMEMQDAPTCRPTT